MAAFRVLLFCALSALIAVQFGFGARVRGSKSVKPVCHSDNATFLRVEEEGLINEVTYINGEYSHDLEIHTDITSISSIAYDPFLEVFLAVNGSNRIFDSPDFHVRISKSDVTFDRIAFDVVTSNIYFASNSNGIGVCAGRKKEAKCTMLIRQEVANTSYHNLIVFPQRGRLIWIEKAPGRRSQVKMSSMNGDQVRPLEPFSAVKSIALATQFDKLYASFYNGSVSSYTFYNESSKNENLTSFTEIFFLHCQIKGYTFSKSARSPPTSMVFSEKVVHVYVNESLVPKRNPCKTNPCRGPVLNALEPNPCENVVCPGSICVLTEASPNPVTRCAPLVDLKPVEPSTTPKVDPTTKFKPTTASKMTKSATTNAPVQVVHHPLSALLIVAVFVLSLITLILLFTLALVISPQFRLWFRNFLPCFRNQGFSGTYIKNRSPTISSASTLIA